MRQSTMKYLQNNQTAQHCFQCHKFFICCPFLSSHDASKIMISVRKERLFFYFSEWKLAMISIVTEPSLEKKKTLRKRAMSVSQGCLYFLHRTSAVVTKVIVFQKMVLSFFFYFLGKEKNVGKIPWRAFVNDLEKLRKK